LAVFINTVEKASGLLAAVNNNGLHSGRTTRLKVPYCAGPYLLILDDRIWSDFSCTTRPGIIFLIGLASLALVISLALLKEKLLARHFPAQQDIAPEPIWVGSKIAYWSVGGVVALVFAAAAVIVSLAPNVTHLMTDGRFLIEKGCFQLRPYETRIDLATANVVHQYNARRKALRGTLLFMQDDKKISINLNTVYKDAILAQIAPNAMRVFARRHDALGYTLHPSVRALLND